MYLIYYGEPVSLYTIFIRFCVEVKGKKSFIFSIIGEVGMEGAVLFAASFVPRLVGMESAARSKIELK